MSNVTTHVRNQIPKATKCDYDTAEPITVGFMELALGYGTAGKKRDRNLK
jgi:hypothetical protein